MYFMVAGYVMVAGVVATGLGGPIQDGRRVAVRRLNKARVDGGAGAVSAAAGIALVVGVDGGGIGTAGGAAAVAGSDPTAGDEAVDAGLDAGGGVAGAAAGEVRGSVARLVVASGVGSGAEAVLVPFGAEVAVSSTVSMVALIGLSLAGNILLAGISGGLAKVMVVVGLLRASKEALRSLTVGEEDDIRLVASNKMAVVWMVVVVVVLACCRCAV